MGQGRGEEHVNEQYKFVSFSANKKTKSHFPVRDWPTVEAICNEFNNSLRFDPSTPLMAYTIRDPVVNGKYLFLNFTCIVDIILLKMVGALCPSKFQGC